ncbi:hypothetical protein [Limnohabitans sp. WS1]|nr:hypothetical protein [Limnohabitans sp. WS1]
MYFKGIRLNHFPYGKSTCHSTTAGSALTLLRKLWLASKMQALVRL